MSVAIALTLAGCFVAGYFDIKARRIPNVLTGSLAVAALIVHGFGGWRPLVVSLAIMIVLLLAGSLIYSRGGFGGGDVKLAVAASGMLGYPLFVPFLLYTAIGGGLLAIGYLLVRGRMASMSRGVMMTLAGAPGVPVAKAEGIPYAVAFAFGAILVALSQSIAPFLRIAL